MRKKIHKSTDPTAVRLLGGAEGGEHGEDFGELKLRKIGSLT
jgi:hypothetical protein